MLRKLIFATLSISLVAGFFVLVVGPLLGKEEAKVTVVVDSEYLPVTVFSPSGFEMSQNEDTFSLIMTDDKFLYRFVSSGGLATDYYDVSDRQELRVDFIPSSTDAPPPSSVEENFQGSEVRLKTLRSYENDKWVIALAVTTNIASDGSIGIYVLDDGAYRVVFSGTGPDLSTLLDAGIPEAVALTILEDYSALSQL